MKKTKKYVAIAPETGVINSYLTNGKEYQVISYETRNLSSKVHSFSIRDDDGDILRCCLPKKCNHLNKLNWTLKEVK